MALLDETIKSQVREILSKLEGPVKLVVFTQGEGGLEEIVNDSEHPEVVISGVAKPGGGLECEMCSETRQIAEEVAALSDKIDIEVLDFVKDEERAGQYGVDKIPAIVIMKGGEQPVDYGIRFFGMPAGYEFSSLLEDILMVGRGRAELSGQTRDALKKLDKPVHIQVLVTPTWPYCPQAVVLAHRLALSSDKITADMVEATEFPHLAFRYQVYGVPRIVINEVIHIEGAVPERAMVEEMMTVMDEKEMERRRKEFNLELQ